MGPSSSGFLLNRVGFHLGIDNPQTHRTRVSNRVLVAGNARQEVGECASLGSLKPMREDQDLFRRLESLLRRAEGETVSWNLKAVPFSPRCGVTALSFSATFTN